MLALVAAASSVPPAVNYHFTRTCQYHCAHCFHANTNAYIAPLDVALGAVDRLAAAGVRKLNLAGGEPLLYPDYSAALLRHAKALGMFTSVITNGARATPDWLESTAGVLDVFGVSVDSFQHTANVASGRATAAGATLEYSHLLRLRDACAASGTGFKLNTVVHTGNVDDDVGEQLLELAPMRWKVFQMLLIRGENGHAAHLQVDDAAYDRYLARHAHVPHLVAEPNSVMRNSYVVMDERMRLLDCSKGGKVPSPMSVIEDVHAALAHIGFDDAAFRERDGNFFSS